MIGRFFSWEDPRPMAVPGRPELDFFPERITLESLAEGPDGLCLRTAVYVPDLSTFEDDGEPGGLWLYGLIYVGAADPEGAVRVHVSLAGDWMEAEKLYQGKILASVRSVERWDRFYAEVGALPIAPGERALVERQRPAPDRNNPNDEY